MNLINDFLYSLILLLAIIIPAFLAAWQEIEAEGLYGWGSLLPTKRYSARHPLSKIFRLIYGHDKEATNFAIASTLLWLFIYLSLWLVFPISQYALTNHIDWSFFAVGAGLFISCYLTMCVVEDYLWFVLNPYYGPERFNSYFIPWFQNFYGCFPKSYLIGISFCLVAIIVAWLISGKSDLLVVWGLILMELGFFILIIKKFSKKRKRHPLNPGWWREIKTVTITRHLYPVEEVELLE